MLWRCRGDVVADVPYHPGHCDHESALHADTSSRFLAIPDFRQLFEESPGLYLVKTSRS